MCIVYWGSNFNTVNEKIMEVNNVLTFIQSDMLKNMTLYFDYDQNTGNIYPRSNIDVIIQDRIRNKGYKIRFVESINVISFEKEQKPGGGTFENLYRVGIRVRWKHKNYSKNYDVEILLSSYDYKKIISGQNLGAVSLSLNIPSTH